jgi:serine/threonine protein kinase
MVSRATGPASFEEQLNLLAHEAGVPNAELQRPVELSDKKLVSVGAIGRGDFGLVHLGLLFGSKGAGERIREALPQRSNSSSTGLHKQLSGTKVAIKSLLPSENESSLSEARQRLLMEAAIMAQFDHPNVLKSLGVVTRNHQCKLILQHCTFGSLDVLLQDESLFPDGVGANEALVIQVAAVRCYHVLLTSAVSARGMMRRTSLVAGSLHQLLAFPCYATQVWWSGLI